MFEELKPHLTELRKRLFISVSCIFVMFFVCFYFNQQILGIMYKPVIAILPDSAKQINFIEIQEPLFTAMKVSFFAAFVFSSPIVFWQFWKFVAPGLYDSEKRLVIPFVFFATLMFLLGACFCYFIAIPMAFKFLVDFGVQMQNFKPVITSGPYIGFFIKLVIAFGLAFEMPVLTFFFAKLGLIDDAFLTRHFRVAVLIIFIFSALMTPPDIISQFLMAGPLCALYGFSILIAKKINPAKKDENADE
ncbi:twin-arginine translocase subunit TatC [Campylobacter sp. US33a]|uniref:Sec-independent protein translocase protein TatC n=1 Tax=Campylobacter sp. CCS1377 TaxID=3158229 RepID=A0AAU7E9A5_9BACT|nr:twin-arginine translocase subunit TatC [Campylobacter sp. US33a]MCW1360091.1 twin-arginine translocase subunit TatC [Campylobacter jejuni]TEY02395.1 twin-arginine translocase subunit TatC [Campylobacter sp. US33a]